MAYYFSKQLFCPDGVKFCFNVQQCHDADELQSLIEFGGGRITEMHGRYTINLLNAGTVIETSNVDIYSTEFILKSCIHNSILPLENFRLNITSNFDSEFDPNHILYHQMSWEEAMKSFKRKSIICNLKEFRNPEGCVIINGSIPTISIEDCSLETNGPVSPSDGSSFFKPTTTRRRHRQDFSEDDRVKIVNFLVENQKFHELSKGDTWKQMAKTFKHRNWESLKGHFLKKIVPMITKYNVPQDIVNQLKSRKHCDKVEKVEDSSESSSDHGNSSNSNLSDPNEVKNWEQAEDESIFEDPVYIFNLNTQDGEEIQDVSKSSDESLLSRSEIVVNSCFEGTDSVVHQSVQTEDTMIFPLPEGWEYPTTFANAFRLLAAKRLLHSSCTKPS